MSMKTEQGALTFIYSRLIAVVKLTHTFKETDICALNCSIIDSFSCKMPEIHFETLWKLNMAKRADLSLSLSMDYPVFFPLLFILIWDTFLF